MTSLKHLIESMVGEILSEVVPKKALKSIAGKYLWADPEQGMRRDNVEERDTKSEAALLKYIRGWYISGMPSAFIKAVPIIERLIDEGHFAKYFKPPNQPVYRFISDISVEVAANILNVEPAEIFKSEGQIAVFGGGTLEPQQPMTSWTIDPGLTDLLSLGEPRGPGVTILFKANPNAAKNYFMLNPIELVKTFEPDYYSEFLEAEMEVVALGDVYFDAAAVFYSAEGVKRSFIVSRKLVAALTS